MPKQMPRQRLVRFRSFPRSLLCLLLIAPCVQGDEPAQTDVITPPSKAIEGGVSGEPAVGAPDADGNPVDLAMKQAQLADRYRQLETLMLKMAEYDSATNPRRSALLKQALGRSKERQIGGKLNEIVQLFQREQLQRAVDDQGAVQGDLRMMLELLLSENRPDRLKNEQSRVRDYIKRLDRIIRQQKSVTGRTEGGDRGDRLAEAQERIADVTRDLGDDIDESEGTKPEDGSKGSNSDSPEGHNGELTPQSDSQPGDSQPGDSQPGDSLPGESDSAEGGRSSESPSSNPESGDKRGEDQPSESSSEESESDANSDQNGASKNSESSETPEGERADPSGNESQSNSQGQPSEGQPSEGQPSEVQPAQGSPQPSSGEPQGQQPEFPGRKRIEAAEDRMRHAQEQLDQATRDEAIDAQREAQQLLEQAKAELEEILRQLREEEVERVLAMLEGRFRKMLELELNIRTSTQRLGETPAPQRTRQFTVRAGKLSQSQRQVVLEVDRALALLREEGSSVAFPEAVTQMRADMNTVAERLVEEKVGAVTLAIEDDIIAALEEMIAALDKAQKDAEERKSQPQQQPGTPMDPSEQPLVDQIAELKMIRALQIRVNSRTTRFANLLKDTEDPVGQATESDLVDSLRELSDRQQRIHQVTSDIVLGKNK